MVDYVKYSMWLPILAVPFMVFWARPQSHTAWRIGRLVAAVAMLYVAFGLIMYHQYTLRMSAAEAVQEQTVECPTPPCESWPKTTVSWRVVAFTPLIIWCLWWPLLFYIGLWELVWRVRHRKEIRALPRRDSGVVFSSSLILFSVLASVSLYLFLAYEVGFYKGLASFGIKFFGFLLVFFPWWLIEILFYVASFVLDILNI